MEIEPSLVIATISSITTVLVALTSAWLVHSTSQRREIRRANHDRFASAVSRIMGELVIFSGTWDMIRENAARTGPHGPAGSSPDEWEDPSEEDAEEAHNNVLQGLDRMATSRDVILRESALLDVYGPPQVVSAIREIDVIAHTNMAESLQQEIITHAHTEQGRREMQRAYDHAVTEIRKALEIDKTKGLN